MRKVINASENCISYSNHSHNTCNNQTKTWHSFSTNIHDLSDNIHVNWLHRKIPTNNL